MQMTRAVKIGNKIIGGGNNIVVQSMTNTKTSEIDKTVDQIKQLESVGCDIVRCSVPDEQSAKALAIITKQINIPLVADIHFDYKLAIQAASNGASKIRINPGNIGDTGKIKYLADYLAEREIPIRIGVNSGSIQKDLQHHHDKAFAMCESAMRHIHLLEAANFDNIVVSVKASNVVETISAYRLLSTRTFYPLHLGVTEAGIYEMGVIKSSIGIGSLLCDGIGDTIRVSLTDDPCKEVKVARQILRAVGIDKNYVEIISCPTCARTEINVEVISNSIAKATENIKKPIKIAVMGCVVNGPGEAKECDFGVAGGKEKSAIFSNGKVLKTIKNEDILKELLGLIDKMI